MTNAEADALIETLPQPRGLRLAREGERIVMSGGQHGSHSITTRESSAERLLSHWQGYVENNGRTLGPGYTRAVAKTTTAKPRAKTSKTRRRKRAFKRMGVVGIYSDQPDGYIILKPHSTQQATDKVYGSEAQARKAARTLDDALSNATSKHSLAAIQWVRR
jgi:hypothetical protein